MNSADWFFAPHMRLGRVVYYNEKKGFGFIQDLGIRGVDSVGISFFHTGRYGYCRPELSKGWCGVIDYTLPNTERVYPKKGDMVTFWNHVGPDWGKPEARCLCFAKDFLSVVQSLTEKEPSRYNWQGLAPLPIPRDKEVPSWWVDTYKLG